MSKTIKINERSIELLKKKIVLLEGRNLHNRVLTDPQVIREIQKYIEEEVKCYSNQ